jgi:sensor histidine kinase YesM
MDLNKLSTIKKAGIIFIFVTVMGLISFSTIHTERLTYGSKEPFYYPLIWQMTGYYSAFILLPLILWLAKYFPICRKNWYKMFGVHLLGSMVYGFFHTILMKYSRILIYKAFALGVYDYGDMRYRFLMEYHQQLVGYFAVLGIYYLVQYYQENRERELKTAELELKASQLTNQLTQVQLQALKAQINPHFLFNTLNMISSLMYEDVRAADKMISKLSSFLRMTFDKGTSQKLPLGQELEFVKSYLDIMKARFPDKIQIKITAKDVDDLLVPSLLLQPLIENSIKHNNLSNNSYQLNINAYIKDDKLMIEISDNGVGIKGNLLDAFNKGVGLSNTKERLQQLYGVKHKLELHNNIEGGLQILIELPLEKDPTAVEVLV